MQLPRGVPLEVTVTTQGVSTQVQISITLPAVAPSLNACKQLTASLQLLRVPAAVSSSTSLALQLVVVVAEGSSSNNTAGVNPCTRFSSVQLFCS